MKARLMRPFEWRVWHLYLMAAVASVVVLLVFGAGVIGSLYLRGLSHRETTRNRVTAANNRRSIANLARIQRLEKPPTQAQLTAAALRALAAIRACAKSPSCRRQNPGVRRVARNLGTGRIPTRRPSRGNGSRSDGSGGQGGRQTGGQNPARNPSPAPTGRTPQPTTRPRAPAPAPSPPPANPPAARPPAAPPAQSAPAPTPQPPAPVPTVTAPPTPTVPPVPPVVPPVTVPVPIRICAPPLIVVNCRNPQSGAIRSAEAEADPASNSGRGSGNDLLCDRLKVPCAPDGSPVFPPGLIRLP